MYNDLLVPVSTSKSLYNMVKFKIYVTQITIILATKLTVLVIHIRGVWGSSNQITQHLRQ